MTRGQALLGSQASARQNLTARRSRAADRSGERHGWSIGVWVRPHRDALRRQPTKRSIAVRVRPPGNWLPFIDCQIDAGDAQKAVHLGAFQRALCNLTVEALQVFFQPVKLPDMPIDGSPFVVRQRLP